MNATADALPIAIADIEAAALTLAGVAHRTPVLRSTTLDARTGLSVLAKAECFQRTGSFKFRGAYCAMASLDPAQRAGGVLAVSSGNHAQAVALAARLHGTSCTVLMPADAPRGKMEATVGYGAEVVTYDRYREDRDERAEALRVERGLPMIPPFDHPVVMAGQGTAALELVHAAGPLDTLVVPVSGGGLIAGSAVAARARCPAVRVVGVEPEAGDDTRRSLAAGERVRISVPRTIADGLQVQSPGRMPFEVISALVSEVVTVTDAELVAAMVFAYERMKIVLEPSGAAGLAAILTGRAGQPGQRVGVILSGGNVAASRFAELVADQPSP